MELKALKRIYEYRAFYFMALPGLAYFFIFHYLPMVGISVAFIDYRLIDGFYGFFTGKFVGLVHFKKFFGSYYFSRIFFNTLIISSLKLLFGFPAPIILALLLNEIKSSFYKRLTQTVSYLPYFLSWVVVASLIKQIFSPSTGILNEVLEALGLTAPINFLDSPRTFRALLVSSEIWKNVGWGTIIFLAAIASIDTSLYEAATVDGVSRFQKIVFITLPGISEVIVIILILSIGNILNAGFEQIFLLYSVTVYEVADIIDTYVFREGLIKLNYSFSTAVGLTKSVIALFLVIVANKFARRFESGRLW